MLYKMSHNIIIKTAGQTKTIENFTEWIKSASVERTENDSFLVLTDYDNSIEVFLDYPVERFTTIPVYSEDVTKDQEVQLNNLIDSFLEYENEVSFEDYGEPYHEYNQAI